MAVNSNHTDVSSLTEYLKNITSSDLDALLIEGQAAEDDGIAEAFAHVGTAAAADHELSSVASPPVGCQRRIGKSARRTHEDEDGEHARSSSSSQIRSAHHGLEAKILKRASHFDFF